MNQLIIKEVAVISKDDEEYFNLDSDRGEILDCDYAQTVVLIDDEIIYWNDNIHHSPDIFMSGFIKALDLSGVNYEYEEAVMYAKDLEGYKGCKY
jgi:hypothetical protein